MTTPTEKQYRYLRNLGSGAAIIVARKRETEMYLRRGWVTADLRPEREYPYSWVRITAEGLHALAAAVAKYGLPELGREETQMWRRVCADCGSSKYRNIKVPAAQVLEETP